jgi:putative DNA-invertase from lambdoid prophage Rac
MKVALYARVSTEDQHVRQQLERLESYARARGWEVVRKIADTESGRKPLMERKKFRKLLQSLEGLDAVVVYNTDRLTRNWEDEPALEAAFSGACTLLSMSDAVDLSTASGRLMFRMKMAVACYMPEDMREKQKIGIERAKREGKYCYGRGRPKHN